MEDFNQRWQQVICFFQEKFTDGEVPQMDIILFLIGVQELGEVKSVFSKDEKVNLMHIATCKLLEPYGYYAFDHYDDEAWPHFIKTKNLEKMPAQEQEKLMQEAIINYFDSNNII